MGMKLGANPELARKGKYTFEQAIRKIYLIKNKTKPGGRIDVPNVLVGKRVKLVLVDDEGATS